jgi:hypothetical protein
MIKIAISGLAGSGKSTVAKILATTVGGSAVELAFADPIKRACRDIWGFSDQQLWGPSERREEKNFQGVSVRRALQQLGTEYGRALCADVWIEHLLAAAQKLSEGGTTYSRTHGITYARSALLPKMLLVTDLRFENEARALRAYGFKTLHVKRPGLVRLDHASEGLTWLDAVPPDHIFENDGDLLDLERDVRRWRDTLAAP